MPRREYTVRYGGLRGGSDVENLEAEELEAKIEELQQQIDVARQAQADRKAAREAENKTDADADADADAEALALAQAEADKIADMKDSLKDLKEKLIAALEDEKIEKKNETQQAELDAELAAQTFNNFESSPK